MRDNGRQLQLRWFDGNVGNLPKYVYRDRAIKLFGEPAARYNYRQDKDDYTEASNLFDG